MVGIQYHEYMQYSSLARLAQASRAQQGKGTARSGSLAYEYRHSAELSGMFILGVDGVQSVQPYAMQSITYSVFVHSLTNFMQYMSTSAIHH